MVKSTANDAQALISSLRTAYASTPTNLKVNMSTFVKFIILFHYHKL